MCGITGFAGRLAVGSPEATRDLIVSATDVLSHRGPDGDGFWVGPDVPLVLGHRRLAIIDLTDAASQPMVLAGGRHVITFNGEIYNYREIRVQIEAAGHIFTTLSDTEVLLAGCALWGPEKTLEMCRGFFAFAYADLDHQQLWLARDRFGEKPLYWSCFGGSIAFASELKSLRTLPGFPTEISRDSLDEYLRYQAISSPRTVFSNVQQMRPGTLLQLPLGPHIDPNDVTEHVYWDSVVEARRAIARPFRGSIDDAMDELDSVLGASVKSSMVSDVPLGAFLSGGIDSSLVVALMGKHGDRAVRTFTIGFEEARMSEADEARAVANHLGSDHTEFTVTAQEALDVIPRLATMYDEPFGDSSQIPTHLVSAQARQRVTVALSGDGGDELFGGYNRYFLAGEAWSKARRVPQFARTGASKFITSLSPATWDKIGAVAARGPLKKLKGGIGDRAHKLAGVIDARHPTDLYDRLLTQWPAGTVKGSSPPPLRELASGLTFTEQMMLADTRRYLPDDILTKVDRAAMATSLETRVPILNPDVYRFAWTLPNEYKVVAGTGKIVMRELLARYVPRPLIERPKMGFGMPIDSWLRGPLREWGESLLEPSALEAQGLLPTATIRRTWEEHQSGQRNWQQKLWGVLMLQAWIERWT